MPGKKTEFTINFGGWYQRTTLHLSEIYDLFALGHSDLKLDPVKLKALYEKLGLKVVSRESGDFEYIKGVTTDGIEVRYYEDGLYVLSIKSDDIIGSRQRLQNYYDLSLSPAIAYIFSLGAPTPRELAAMVTHHPTVISTTLVDRKKIFSLHDFGEIYSQFTGKNFTIYKTPQYIIVSHADSSEDVHALIEMQIFFREFKDQLHRYLILHREIWEEISDIKERGMVRGSEIENLRARLDSLQKTVNLINSRLNQMHTYVRTRASISKKLNLEDALASVFQYKFETLSDTHAYIQEVWKMTRDYVDTAISVLNDVKSQSTSNGINSLRLITTIGVLSGILGYLSRNEFPNVTLIGLWYFVILILGTWLINLLVNRYYQNSRYRLKFTKKLGI